MLSTIGKEVRARVLLSIAAVLVFVGGQLGTLTHNAFVQHRVCAEHNELEHSSGDGMHGTSAAPRAAHRAARISGDAVGAAVHAAGGDQGNDGHDHCEVASFVRQPLGTATVTVAPTHAPPAQLSDALDARLTVSTQASYRLAPKQSPPA